MVAGKKVSPLVVIVGETASGKSSLALELAQRMNGEIINADSWAARREVNVGTAKPTANDRAAVPHHLLDIVGPCEDFTAAVYKELAQQAIVDITTRGKLPIMVGGTGLYIDAVLYDFGFLEAGDRTNRTLLNSMSIPALLAEIQAKAIKLGEVDVRNKRRLIRLLETGGAKPSRGKKRENTIVLGILTDPEVLEKRITDRVDDMILAGLEGEVCGLIDRYGWQCEALKGVGYAQWRGYFSGEQTLDETRQKIIKATRELAKRQRTWFKRNKSIHWIHTPVNTTKIVDLITTHLDK